MFSNNSFSTYLRLFILLVNLVYSSLTFGQADSLMAMTRLSTNIDSTLKQCKKYVGLNNIAIDDSNRLICVDSLVAFCVTTNNEKWEYKFKTLKSKIHLKQQQYLVAVESAFQIIDQIEDKPHIPSYVYAHNFLTISIGFENIGAYAEAITYRKKELKILGQKKFRQTKLNALNNIGKLHLKLLEFDSAIAYYHKALLYTSSLKSKTNNASAHNNIGLVFFERRDFDSAQIYFSEALKLFNEGKKETDSVMVGIVGGNLAQCFPIAGNKKKIEQLLFKNIAITKHPEYQTSLRNAYFDVANLYYETNELSICEKYLDSAFAVNEMLPESFEKDDEKANMYAAYLMIYKKTKDYKSQAKYLEKLNQINNTLYGKNEWTKSKELISEFQVKSIQNKLALEKALLAKANDQLEILSYQNKLKNWQIGIIALIGIMLISFLSFFYAGNQKLLIRQKQISELKSKMLSLENKTKKERLNQAAISLKRKETFANEIIKRVNKMAQIQPTDLSEMKIFISNELQIDSRLIQHEELLSNIDESFFSALAFKHPDLSKTDVQLCSLIFLDLSIKEIATVKNITPNSVKIAKNRLSKKLQLAPGSSVFKYLSSI